MSDDDMQDLDDRIRAHYSSRSLDPATLERLMDATLRESDRTLMGAAPGAGSQGRGILGGNGLLAAAALIVFVIGLLYIQTLPPGIPHSVAVQIAKNHKKHLDPEFRTGDYASLVQSMSRLDFAPVEPQRLREPRYRLVGARYCSVGGQIAVQCSLLDVQGRYVTLYEFRPGEVYARLEDSTFDIDGVSVRVWREGPLVMGLAENSE